MRTDYFKIVFFALVLTFASACNNKKAENTQNSEQIADVENLDNESNTAETENTPKNVVFETLDAVGFKMKMLQIGTAKKVAQRKMRILDVRTAIEYNKVHIEDAMNIDFNAADFKENVEKQLEKEIPVFVYAESAEKAKSAGELLKSLNFRAVFVLNAPFAEWQKEKYDAVYAM